MANWAIKLCLLTEICIHCWRIVLAIMDYPLQRHRFLGKGPSGDGVMYYHKERRVLEDIVDPQLMQRFKKPPSFYEYLPEMINKQRNLDFPFATFQTAYQPHAPYKYS